MARIREKSVFSPEHLRFAEMPAPLLCRRARDSMVTPVYGDRPADDEARTMVRPTKTNEKKNDLLTRGHLLRVCVLFLLI